MNKNDSTKWVETDLLSLINIGVEESIELEYKACAALSKEEKRKTEIGKDISSFANSAGGIIVYGIKEKGNKPYELDEGFDPTDIAKEWVEQVIKGNIRPRIQDLHINPVELVTTNPGKVAYVISVPASTTAHQASDKRYYKRFNFEAVPMEDYEIRDTMNRSRYPNLRPVFLFQILNLNPIPLYKMNISIKNDGPVRVRDFKFIFYWPKKVNPKVGKGFRMRIVPGPPTMLPPSDLVEFTVQRSDVVIFPEDEWRLTDDGIYEFQYHVDKQEVEFFLDTDTKLIWQIFADDMPVRRGEELLSDLRAF